MSLQFSPTPNGVEASVGGFTFPLTDKQVDLMMDDLQEQERRAEAAAAKARKAFNALWDARCAAVDAKGLTRSSRMAGRG